MVKTRGPVLSHDAAGKLAHVLVYAQSKRRRYAKRLRKPRNPRTFLQQSQRAATQFITQKWSASTAAQQASWSAVYTDTDMSLYHRYLKFNLDRWSRGLPPARVYPPLTSLPTPGAFPFTLTTFERFTRLAAQYTAVPNPWGIAFTRSLNNPVENDTQHVRLVLPTIGAYVDVVYDDYDMTPGTWYWSAFLFTVRADNVQPYATLSRVI